GGLWTPKRGPVWAPFLRVVRRCPTLPHCCRCSTIGAGGLSFRVRNVAGRFPSAVTAVTLCPPCVRGWLSVSPSAFSPVLCLGVGFWGVVVFEGCMVDASMFVVVVKSSAY